MIKLAFFDTKPYDEIYFNEICKDYGVSIKYFESKLNRDTAEMVHGYDAVCAFVNDNLNREVIDILSSFNVKAILLRCSGYNNVDIKRCKEKNIALLRVPAYSPYSVAEHAMAMLLLLNRKLHKAYIRTRDQNFSLTGLLGFDLKGKTVGIIGTGKIGKVFSEICRGFGMNVLGYDLYPDEKSGIEYADFSEICKRSDIISLHCPLTPETKYIINERSLSDMKDGVVIINTSRGRLIDSDALLEAIKTGKVGAAGLDVYEEESDLFFEDFSGEILQDDILSRLLSMPNVLITSHQAFFTREALSNIAKTTMENAKGFFEEGKRENEVKSQG